MKLESVVKQLESDFEKAIKEELNNIKDRVLEEAQKKLTEELNLLSDRIALSLIRQYDMRIGMDCIQISVRKVKP